MSTSSATASSEFLALVRKSGVVEEAKLADLFPAPEDVPEDPQRVAAVLIRAGLLTQFQSRQLLAGKFRGFLLGVYKILQPIGKGGMGTVFLAEHTGLKRKVALKVLPNNKAESKLALERFQREARAAAALDHLNIVRLHDISQGNGLHFLVLEYVEGVDLQSLMAKTGPLHFVQAVQYVAQAAAGLQHAHDRGFVHRDIKPANMMLAKDGVIKILDMGLARSFTDEADKLTEQLGDATEVAGTADYISPEQALNQPVDERSDIYSLGATLFALMTGHPPFRGTTAQKLMQHQVADPPSLTKLRGMIPPPLNAVVAKMMAKKKAERYQSMTEVIDALSPWLPAPTTGNITQDPMNTAEILAARSSAHLAAATPAPTGTLAALPAAASASNRRVLFIAGGVAAAVVALGGGGAAYFGMFGDRDSGRTVTPPQQPPTVAAASTSPKPTPSPTPAPNPAPKPAPKVAPKPVAKPAAVWELNFADVEPRTVALTRSPSHRLNPTMNHPLNTWLMNVWAEDASGEAAVEPGEGGALSVRLRNVSGTPSAQLFGTQPVATLEAGRGYTLRLRYKAGPQAKSVIDLRSTGDPKNRITKATITHTSDWANLDVPLRADVDTPLHVFVQSLAEGPDADVVVGGVTLFADGAAVTPPAPTAAGKVLYRLDLLRQSPFSVRVQCRQKDNDPKTKEHVVLDRSGGEPPAGWRGSTWNPQSEGEWSARLVDGEMALGARNPKAPGSMMVFMPEFTTATGTVRLRFDYRLDSGTATASVRFKPNKPTAAAAWDVAKLPTTNGVWVTKDLDVNLKGTTAGFFEIHNAINNPEVWLYVRDVTVSEMGTGSAAVAPPSAAPAARGRSVYRLDLSATQPFVLSRLGRTDTGKVGDGTLPPKWVAGSWQPDNAHEVVAEPRDGAMALGLRTVTGTPGAMLALADVPVAAGKAYEVRYEYMTTGQFRPGVVRTRDEAGKLTDVGRTDLTAGSWRTGAAPFVASGAAAQVEFHHLGPAGEGNELFVRNVEVFEVGN